MIWQTTPRDMCTQGDEAMPPWEGAHGCTMRDYEQEESALDMTPAAPSPWCLPLLICEMGAGKGWKPRPGRALERGSEENESEVRARSCRRGPWVMRLEHQDTCDKFQHFFLNL